MKRKSAADMGSDWLEEHIQQLERDHPNEWVAADDGGLVAHDASIDVVTEKVSRAGKQGYVTYAHIVL